MTGEAVVALLVALSFSAAHLFGGRLTFLDVTPRSIWLSIAGGVSVAYVFVHLLPEIAEHQEAFARSAEQGDGFAQAIELHVYLFALIGLGVFYGLERLACRSQAGRGGDDTDWIFWIHLGSFAVYNFLLGYMLLHRGEAEPGDLFFYAIAILLHFIVNDHALREHHGTAYHRNGRWLLAAAPLMGWLLGVMTDVSELLIAASFGFLAGGIVLNVLKEELPESRESRFWAFALGGGAYAALLVRFV